MIRLALPLEKKKRIKLKAGQRVLLSGRLFTARDMAHKRLTHMLDKRIDLPINLRDEVLYYCGPTPPPPGRPIGSCGPTTSSRMDAFTPLLLRSGLGGMIGKGRRSERVRRAIKKYKAVYFIATGGAGAMLAHKVERMSVVAFRDLGTEAIHELYLKDFPVVVAIDSKGRDIYDKVLLRRT
jgi:fumarate hydratase subunit beta